MLACARACALCARGQPDVAVQLPVGGRPVQCQHPGPHQADARGPAPDAGPAQGAGGGGGLHGRTPAQSRPGRVLRWAGGPGQCLW
jgi:hypothetical protein